MGREAGLHPLDLLVAALIVVELTAAMTSWLPGFLASLAAPFSVKHPLFTTLQLPSRR